MADIDRELKITITREDGEARAKIDSYWAKEKQGRQAAASESKAFHADEVKGITDVDNRASRSAENRLAESKAITASFDGMKVAAAAATAAIGATVGVFFAKQAELNAEARRNVDDLIKKYQEANKLFANLAPKSGAQAGGAYTVQQLQGAARAGVDAETFAQAGEGIRGAVGNLVGNQGWNQAKVDDLTTKSASLAAGLGVGPMDIAPLIGDIANRRPDASTDDILDEAAKVAAGLAKGRGGIRENLGAYGAASKYGRGLSAVSAVAATAGTGIQGKLPEFQRGIDKMLPQTAAGLGLQPGMDLLTQMGTIAESIEGGRLNGKKASDMLGGVSFDEFDWQEALRAYRNPQGAAARQAMAASGPGAAADVSRRYLASEVARSNSAAANLQASQVGRGMRYQALDLNRSAAEAQLTTEGAFDIPQSAFSPSAWIEPGIAMMHGVPGDLKDRAIRARVAQSLTSGFAGMGVGNLAESLGVGMASLGPEGGYKANPFASDQSLANASAMAAGIQGGQAAAGNDAMLAVLQVIAENTKQQRGPVVPPAAPAAPARAGGPAL